MTIEGQAPGDDKMDSAPIFFAPELNETVSGFLPVVTVAGVNDVNLIEPGNVVSFHNLAVLKLVCENPGLFKDRGDFVVIAGYPNAVYNDTFNRLTWNLEKVSFDQLVGDIATQKKIDSLTKDQPKKRPDGSKAPKEAKPQIFDAFDRFGDEGPGDEAE